MSRIRSIHPKLFTDEAFMDLTADVPLAAVAYMALLTECDDEGAFEWKPRTLKARILPAAACEMSDILQALIGAGFVRTYEIDGRQYGAVKNFCRYQSPRKPTVTCPKTPEVRNFVGTNAEPVQDECDTSTELSIEREKEREKEKEWKGEDTKRTRFDVGGAMRFFDEQIFPAYPRRHGTNPRKPAADKFVRLIREGHDPNRILAGVQGYARSRVGEPPQFTRQLVVFLNQHGWLDDYASPMPMARAGPSRASDEIERARRMLRDRNGTDHDDRNEQVSDASKPGDVRFDQELVGTRRDRGNDQEGRGPLLDLVPMRSHA